MLWCEPACGSVVRSGHGVARPGGKARPLQSGSFWQCPQDTGVGHPIEVGANGMQLLSIGNLIPGDVCVYPEKRTFKTARGVELPY